MAFNSAKDDFPQVGFIGLGAMGFAMSTHLVRTGFPVTGYDIYEPTLQKWIATCNEIPDSRAKIAKSPSEAVKDAQVICLMVANHHHVHSALFEGNGAVHSLPKKSTVIIHATIPPTEPNKIRDRLSDEFNRPDIKLIDAPVSGGVARSVNGTLTIMVSSNDMSVLEETDPKIVLDNVASLGKTWYAIPGGLGAGQSAKALNQVMAGVHIPSASEIMGLAAISGIDTQKLYEYLTTRTAEGKTPLGWSWMFENRGPRMLSADPPLASATLIINKDVGIIRDEEVRLTIELSLLNTASEVITQVMKTHAKDDDSCIVKYYLGFDTPQSSLVVDRAGHTTLPSVQEQGDLIKTLAMAHAIIHIISAYETITFAKALDLMRPDQRSQWFSIISGAAGGSSVFSEVIPRAFEIVDEDGGIERAFREYTRNIVDEEKVGRVTKVVEQARKKGYKAIMVEKALGELQKFLA
jgi:3-hydroxyisobutyrate dehydrogenase